MKAVVALLSAISTFTLGLVTWVECRAFFAADPLPLVTPQLPGEGGHLEAYPAGEYFHEAARLDLEHVAAAQPSTLRDALEPMLHGALTWTLLPVLALGALIPLGYLVRHACQPLVNLRHA